MRTDSKHATQQSRAPSLGPAAIFAVTTLSALAALALAVEILPKDLALAAASSIFFAFAVSVAVLAWRFDQPEANALSYWDVSGALTLFGIFAATLMDSDQLVRFIASPRSGE